MQSGTLKQYKTRNLNKEIIDFLRFAHRVFESFKVRQYKELKPAQQALRQPQAPHHAGLFALRS
jgi:hypothetical protein